MDYATGEPRSSSTSDPHPLWFTYHIERATGVTVTLNSASDRLFADWLMDAMRRPDDGSAGVLAKV